MSKKLPAKLDYSNEEVHKLLSSYQTSTPQWVISTFPHPVNQLEALEAHIKESIPKEDESAIFLVPLRYLDGHIAGMIFRKSPDNTIRIFYFDPIGPSKDCRLLEEAEDFKDIVHNIFPDKAVEFHDIVFPIGPAKHEDSPAIVVQVLHDMAAALERNPDLDTRSAIHNAAQIARFHYRPEEIAATQHKHAKMLGIEPERDLERKRKHKEDQDESTPRENGVVVVSQNKVKTSKVGNRAF